MNGISQTQIHEFLYCHNKYYLTNVEKIYWTTPDHAEPDERFYIGNAFHQFAHRFLIGLPVDKLLAAITDTEIRNMADTFVKWHPEMVSTKIYPEITLRSFFGGVMLSGKLDALAVTDEKIIIYDWKTDQKKPHFQKICDSPQTKLYCTLAESLKKTIAPHIPNAQIEMEYWYPNFPGYAIRIPLTPELAYENRIWLESILPDMLQTDAVFFPKTVEMRRCGRCKYERYCFKNAPTSTFPQLPADIEPSDDTEFSPSFDAIAEADTAEQLQV